MASVVKGMDKAMESMNLEKVMLVFVGTESTDGGLIIDIDGDG